MCGMSNRRLSMFYLFISGLFFMAMQVCIKFIPNIPVTQIAFFRGWVTMLFCLIFFARKKVSPFGTHKNKTLLWMRGLFGSVSLLGFFYTLKYLPLATAACLQYLSPIFTVIVASFFVKELPTLRQSLFLTLAFVGVLLLKDINAPQSSTPIMFIGILAAFGAAIAYNTIRRMGKTEHPMVIVFYFPVVLLPIIILPTIYYWHPPSLSEFFLLIAVGCFTHGGQVFMTKAYQMERASNIVVINYLGPVYAVVLGILLFKEVPTLTSLTGICIIVLAAYLTTTTSPRKT